MAEPVLFFDGDCGLCQRLVRVLLRLDRSSRLRFAPLQGATGQAYLQRHGFLLRDFSTLVYLPDGQRPEFLLRTDGVIAALRAAGGAGRFLGGMLALWPRSWRDAGYRLVARGRYRLFGPWRPRRLGRPEWEHRFLE